jgi:hypothetical protein
MTFQEIIDMAELIKVPAKDKHVFPFEVSVSPVNELMFVDNDLKFKSNVPVDEMTFTISMVWSNIVGSFNFHTIFTNCQIEFTEHFVDFFLAKPIEGTNTTSIFEIVTSSSEVNCHGFKDLSLVK